MRAISSPIVSFAILFPSLALLASCVGPGSGPTRPVPAPAPTPVPARPAPAPVSPAQPAPVATEWQYRPATPGSWSYRPEAAGSVAMFGSGTAHAPLTLRCDRASRRISMARSGAGNANAIVVRTSYGATSWPATPANGGANGMGPQIVAWRAASDTVLDQIAYSRGKFAVEVAGQDMLIVPAWAEISRVIEDCRG